MREIKGYVVRGTDKRGNIVTGDGITTTEAAVRATRTLTWGGCTDVAIFRVLDDGREERLPSYEEALTALSEIRGEVEHALNRGECPPSTLRALLRIAGGQSESTDPLAALEAAERRLLESARWTPGDRGFWIDPDDGTQWPREGAISDVRRRLAAKGGA